MLKDINVTWYFGSLQFKYCELPDKVPYIFYVAPSYNSI